MKELLRLTEVRQLTEDVENGVSPVLITGVSPVHRAYAGDQHRAYAVFYVLCQLPHLRQAQQLLHQRLHRAPPFLRSALGGVYDCSIRPEAVTELKTIN